MIALHHVINKHEHTVFVRLTGCNPNSFWDCTGFRLEQFADAVFPGWQEADDKSIKDYCDERSPELTNILLKLIMGQLH